MQDSIIKTTSLKLRKYCRIQTYIVGVMKSEKWESSDSAPVMAMGT